MVAPNEAYWLSVMAGNATLAKGEPGVGKSAVLTAGCVAAGRKPYVLIGSLRDPADIGGCPFPSQRTYDSALLPNGVVNVQKLIPPEWVTDICYGGGKHALILDELTTCPPAVQAALLRVVAERYVGDTAMPRDLWVLGACNPSECAANGVDIEPPLANRFSHHKWEVDTEAILAGYENELRFPPPRLPSCLGVSPIAPPPEPHYQASEPWWPYVGLAGKLVAQFHRRNPSRLLAFPEERAAQCGPWPSPRTWEYAIKTMATWMASGSSLGVRSQILCGLLGEAVGGEMSTYLDNLDLPDPEVLLAEAMAAIREARPMVYSHPDRPDKVLALMASVNQAVITNNTKDRWLGGMAVMDAAAQYDLEVAAAGVAPLARASNGHALPDDFVKRWLPRLQTALGDHR